MPKVFPTRLLAIATVVFLAVPSVVAQGQPPAPTPTELPLFAVEITVGSKWDQSKSPRSSRSFESTVRI